MGKDKGGITVFLAVIFLAMLVFTGSLVDISRIMVAQKKVEGSLAASARSVLSNYDRDLAGEFGLFGLDKDVDMEQELSHYLSLNLMERHEGISFISYEIQSDGITAAGSLLNQDIAKHQILEYMKYRAPVTMTGNLIEQFKKAKLGQKTEFAGKEAAVRDKARQLEQSVKDLNDEVEAINSYLKRLDEHVLEDIQGSLEKVLEEYLPEILRLYEAYGEARKASEDFLDQKDLEDSQSNRDTGINGNGSREFESVPGDCEAIREEALKLKEKVDEARKQIAPVAGEIEDKESTIKSLKRSLADMEKQEDQPADKIEECRGKIRRLQQEVEELEQRISGIIDRLQSETGGKGLQEINLYDDEKDLPEHEGEDNKDKLIDEMNAVKTAFQKLSVHIEQGMLISQGELDYGSAGSSEYFEEMQASIGLQDGSGSDACEKSFSKAYSMLERLRNAVSGSAATLRDKLYLTEYVMDKYTFLTSQTNRNHLFTKGEVEYILNGSDIPYKADRNFQASVIANVLAEVWFLRFSIDSIDAFASSKIAHPLARLAWALAEGAVDASTELLSMLRGEGVKLCPSFKSGPELRYSDHLRLLLLMQDESETIRKIQQLAQVDIKNSGQPGFRLGSCETTVKAETEVSINLYFLPVLKLDKLGFKQFRGGRYVIRREVVLGY